MMAWITIFILTLHKLHALQPFLRGNVSITQHVLKLIATLINKGLMCFIYNSNGLNSDSEEGEKNVTVQMIPFKEISLLELHVELRNFINFATVSQRKCEVQMNNYYLSCPEKLFHSNWNCLKCYCPNDPV
ncbi:hypothetical protein TNCT_223361 [Trichonephila clavata]|uniref:Uncharacterized protein n=1 Tax=Trichonephila clavata TaxID=2740835 RepID=A0A8X6GGK3_TRICU|nr:hypothetical protein TNCT_223361 [Trichonephila clavata]